MSSERLQSHVTGATRPTGRLTFSTLLAVSLVAVLAIAIVAATMILGPRGLFGIGAASPSPGTPTPLPSPTLPLESPTVVPTASPSPTPTIAPTPTPPAAWTGLEWASGPSLPLVGDSMFPRIEEVRWWGGRYVGVGSVIERGLVIPSDPGSESDLRIAPAFFAAEAGSDWRLVQQGEWQDAAVQDSEVATLVHLVDLGDEILAFSDDSPMRGSPSLWSSTDGLSWSLVDSASWAEVWGPGTLTAVDGGAAGAVAIGFDGGGCCLTPPGSPVITYSPDGITWERLDASSVASMEDRSLLTDVLAHPDGFVIVGAAREPDQPRDVEPMPREVGRPAAWTSADGRSWVAADVEGSSVSLGRLSQVVAGADGFFAVGVAQEPEYQWQSSGWASADGHTWRLLGELGVDLPRMRVLTSDGIHITAFGTPTLYSLELAGWSSTDGVEWSPLAMSGTTQLPNGDTQYLGPDGTEGYATDMTAITDAWAVPAGVVVAQPMPAPVGGQWIWVATSVER